MEDPFSVCLFQISCLLFVRGCNSEYFVNHSNVTGFRNRNKLIYKYIYFFVKPVLIIAKHALHNDMGTQKPQLCALVELTMRR